MSLSDDLWPIRTIWVPGKRHNPGHRECIVADPDVQRGRFTVMRRTDGAFIVVDTVAPMAVMTVRGRTFAHASEAVEYAERCAEWVRFKGGE